MGWRGGKEPKGKGKESHEGNVAGNGIFLRVIQERHVDASELKALILNQSELHVCT